MTYVAPAAAGAQASAGASAPVGQPAPRSRPGWPLTALFLLYPLWWALGMGTLIVYVLAAVMVVHLWRRERVSVPPGFGIWLLFLVWVLASATMVGLNPPGTLAEPAGGRLVSVAFTVAGYLVVTVVLLYMGNMTEEEFPRSKLVGLFSYFFLVVVAGGLLGVLAPGFEFTSPVEWLLPSSIAGNPFVRSLVHPAASQLQEVLGFLSPRPSAPFGFTNMWGYCLALLLGWFAIDRLRGGTVGRRLVGVLALAVAAVPVVYSLNRGLWLALGVVVVFYLVRMAARGRVAAAGAVVAVSVVALSALLLSPLASIVQGRLDNPHSNNIRAFTTERTIDAVSYSPVLGLGATRATLGSSNSIAVGESIDCPRCGNAVLGSNGQLWAVLIGQGYGGLILFVGFFLRVLWAFRRDRTPIGDAGLLVLVLSLFFMFIYNAMVMPLIITFLSIALLWRNQRDQRDPAGAGVSNPALPRTA